jgi:hypothetical protein
MKRTPVDQEGRSKAVVAITPGGPASGGRPRRATAQLAAERIKGHAPPCDLLDLNQTAVKQLLKSQEKHWRTPSGRVGEDAGEDADADGDDDHPHLSDQLLSSHQKKQQRRAAEEEEEEDAGSDSDAPAAARAHGKAKAGAAAKGKAKKAAAPAAAGKRKRAGAAAAAEADSDASLAAAKAPKRQSQAVAAARQRRARSAAARRARHVDESQSQSEEEEERGTEAGGGSDDDDATSGTEDDVEQLPPAPAARGRRGGGAAAKVAAPAAKGGRVGAASEPVSPEMPVGKRRQPSRQPDPVPGGAEAGEQLAAALEAAAAKGPACGRGGRGRTPSIDTSQPPAADAQAFHASGRPRRACSVDRSAPASPTASVQSEGGSRRRGGGGAKGKRGAAKGTTLEAVTEEVTQPLEEEHEEGRQQQQQRAGRSGRGATAAPAGSALAAAAAAAAGVVALGSRGAGASKGTKGGKKIRRAAAAPVDADASDAEMAAPAGKRVGRAAAAPQPPASPGFDRSAPAAPVPVTLPPDPLGLDPLGLDRVLGLTPGTGLVPPPGRSSGAAAAVGSAPRFVARDPLNLAAGLGPTPGFTPAAPRDPQPLSPHSHGGGRQSSSTALAPPAPGGRDAGAGAAPSGLEQLLEHMRHHRTPVHPQPLPADLAAAPPRFTPRGLTPGAGLDQGPSASHHSGASTFAGEREPPAVVGGRWAGGRGQVPRRLGADPLGLDEHLPPPPQPHRQLLPDAPAIRIKTEPHAWPAPGAAGAPPLSHLAPQQPVWQQHGEEQRGGWGQQGAAFGNPSPPPQQQQQQQQQHPGLSGQSPARSLPLGLQMRAMREQQQRQQQALPTAGLPPGVASTMHEAWQEQQWRREEEEGEEAAADGWTQEQQDALQVRVCQM